MRIYFLSENFKINIVRQKN